MAASHMHVKLVQTGPVRFVATSPAGASFAIAGAGDETGEPTGMRPMETLLSALGGCSALDVLHIMKKQREDLERLEVEVTGERADAIPAVFTKIHVRFTGYGPIDVTKLQKAVALSMEKYCSVTRMLQPSVEITSEGLLG